MACLRLKLSAALIVLLLIATIADAEESAKSSPIKGIRLQVLESLRQQANTLSHVSYSEKVEFAYAESTASKGTTRAYDWVIGTFPEGDWSCQAEFSPLKGRRTARRIWIRSKDDMLVASQSTDLTWSAYIDDYSEGRLDRLAPTVSRWFPVDGVRVDERLRQFDVLDYELSTDTVVLTVPANMVVLEALTNPKARIHGLFGYRYKFKKVGRHYVLSRCDILTTGSDHQETSKSQLVDDWQREIAGKTVHRAFTRTWSDFRLIEELVLPLKWTYTFPGGVATGRVDVGSIRRLSESELQRPLALNVPDTWSGEGNIRDRRSGEVVMRREAPTARDGLRAPTMPEGYAIAPKTDEIQSRSYLLLGLGIAFAALALWIRYRFRRDTPREPGEWAGPHE